MIKLLPSVFSIVCSCTPRIAAMQHEVFCNAVEGTICRSTGAEAAFESVLSQALRSVPHNKVEMSMSDIAVVTRP